MRNFFEPAAGPPWLKQVLTSIRAALKDIWDHPILLWRTPTASLPTASTDNQGGIAYDSTVDRPAYSNGSAWVTLQPYDASVATIAALSIVQGDLIYGSASEAFSRLAKDANATRYLSNTGTSNNPAWAQVNLTNGVTGDLPFANIVQIATAKVLGRTTAGTGDIEEIATTGTGNVAFSNNPVFGAAAFTGLVQVGDPAVDTNPKLLIRGITYGLRFGTTAAGAQIDGVDSTGVSSYEPVLLNGSTVDLGINGTSVVAVTGSGADVVGLLRCDSFRIDQSPTAETPTATHTITISANGTDFKLLCVAA